MDLFLAPHHDDEALFGAFTLLRDTPLVVVCLRSTEERAQETRAAMDVLGCDWCLLAEDETAPDWNRMRDSLATVLDEAPGRVFAPNPHIYGNYQHNAVANIADGLWRGKITYYATYTDGGKSEGRTLVDYEPDWIGLKLRALACYRSQHEQPGRAVHFLRDQREWYA